MAHIDCGASLLRLTALQRIPADQSYDLAVLFTDLAAQGQLLGYEVFNRFYEMAAQPAWRRRGNT